MTAPKPEPDDLEARLSAGLDAENEPAAKRRSTERIRALVADADLGEPN